MCMSDRALTPPVLVDCAALLGVAGLVAASLTAYAALYMAVGGPFKPAGPMWALCMLWVTSHVGGYISAEVSTAHAQASMGTCCRASSCSEDQADDLPSIMGILVKRLVIPLQHKARQSAWLNVWMLACSAGCHRFWG